ncbi:MAG: DUF2939 domain-containing protein [Steroidobacteraceae bacterium]
MKKASLAFVVLALAWLIASPWITVVRMQSAAAERDADALSFHIDFPAVREDLKGQVNAYVMATIAEESDNNPFAALGGLLASVLVDKLVDAFVTPSGLVMLMEGEDPGLDFGRPDERASSRKPLEGARYRYLGWNRFAVIVPTDDGSETRFVLGRQGLNWRLVAIRLPLER